MAEGEAILLKEKSEIEAQIESLVDEDIAAEAKAAAEKAAAQKKTSITCVKGKLTKKVTAVNPKCPSGYTKR